MTDQPDDWLAAERERSGCATVLGTRAAYVGTRWNYLRGSQRDSTKYRKVPQKHQNEN
jgi:hypothetical protein